MPSFQTAKKWGVPYGTWIILSYEEADLFTSGISRAALSEALSAIGPWGMAAAVAIGLQQKYIRELNEKSNGQGVKLLFVWATGLIMSVERRGRMRGATTPVPSEEAPAPRWGGGPASTETTSERVGQAMSRAGRAELGRGERVAFGALGVTLLTLGLGRRSLGGVAMMLASGVLLYRGLSGRRHVFRALTPRSAIKGSFRHPVSYESSDTHPGFSPKWREGDLTSGRPEVTRGDV